MRYESIELDWPLIERFTLGLSARKKAAMRVLGWRPRLAPSRGSRAKKGTATVLRSGVLATRFQRKTPDLNTFAPSPSDIQVPCWNQRGFTELCVQALFRHTRPAWELIVVDNGSTDDTAAYLAGVRDAAERAGHDHRQCREPGISPGDQPGLAGRPRRISRPAQ